MKRVVHLVGAALLVVAVALPARGEYVPLTPSILHGLTPIDTVPTKDEISRLLPTDTVSQLASLATNAEDFGVRLRAIRALPQFCPASCAGSTPHTTLVNLLASLPNDQAGKTILLQRAAIEAIGIARSGDANDVGRIVPYLDSPSRDIRAAAAFALRDLCDPAAMAPLRNRYNVEMGPNGVSQVRLAISAALRDLGTCAN